MCGIVGYVGQRDAAPLLVEGLRRLEYRGYDSAGLCTLNGSGLHIRKRVGRVEGLAELVKRQPVVGKLGISHTRWATHGPPSDRNSHPHLDHSRRLALVHNGIFENYAAIKQRLLRRGHRFLSQTDSEVLAHLVGHHLQTRLGSNRAPSSDALIEALQAATREAVGAYAIAVVHADLSGALFGARRGSPLVAGVGKGEHFLASDVSPIGPHTRRVVYLHDGDLVRLSADSLEVFARGRPARRPVSVARWSAEAAERGRFPHYMLKEIHEQPERVAEVVERTVDSGSGAVRIDSTSLKGRALAGVRRLLLVACGTSWHAALTGEYLLETLAGLPVDVECASELRYRDRPLEPGTLVISISQSGETADTLAAARQASAEGAATLAIVNVAGSTLARESRGVIEMRAGPEIGVASTKAFEMQVLWLTLLGMMLGRSRGRLSTERARRMARELREIPAKLRQVLATSAHIRQVARKYSRYTDFLFLGRQLNFPIALEGALKLKEISYLHADAYPSAEMKHGPIALISPQFPSVFLVPRDAMYDKNLANLAEIKARKGPVLAIATTGDRAIQRLADDVLYVPPTLDILQPLLTVVPLQLFAYHVAVHRGCDVDKPRNLAKSVTVE